MKGVSETTKNEAKEQKVRFLGILIGTLGASILRNLLTDKGKVRADKGTIRADEGTIIADEGSIKADENF